ncbi:hypothetical protein HYS28_02925 [Candidatus Uhrbacteria bacterium]|nr:hypothetical protein [Candidatus Uhrbacteria bacterium]
MYQGATKDVVDVITGNVQTPSKYINYQEESVWGAQFNRNYTLAEMFANNEDAFIALGMNGLSMFTNTFISQFTNKLYSGLFDFDAVTTNPFDDGLLATSSREEAQERFRSLSTITPLEVTNYSLLSEFSSCPSTSRGLYNCVLDASFASAIARADSDTPLTIEEAIEEELLDGTWPLIPSEDKPRNQDPYCYSYGFCHSNLVKLRKARIIPVGWELAAESAYNDENDPVTLQEAIDGFDDCGDDGEPDESHPWCKLVDPNWVLKYPETQCRNLAYGQLLESSAADSRKQECVDMPSCIDENDDGTCSGGYGYCVREENVWRFRGESCPEYASSCLTFEEAATGEDASMLTNTVDYADCDESNAGCMWYATEKEEGSDGSFDWPTVADVASEDEASGTYASRIYFTDEVETCDDEAGGCAKLVERTDDLRLNVIPNSSFDSDEDGNDVPDVWNVIGSITYDETEAYSLSGGAAINTGASGLAYQAGIVLEQGSFYTLSYYARQTDSSGTAEANVIVSMSGEDGSTVDLSGTSYTSDCNIFSTDDSIMQLLGTPTSEDFERFECTFTVPSLTDASENIVAFVDVLSGDLWVDDVQLEQGEDASDYHDGYSEATLTYTYAKVAPSYLGCTGDDDDPEACDNYAQVCSETDVGCLEYTPTNGDPAVFGVASSLDECPSTCVGYDTYKQEETLYEPEGDFPVYFIPDSAELCTEEEVGCDEFTKLDDESLAYFTYLRACVTEDQADANTNGDQGEVFYTWEGSDLEGYQLVTWSLLESDLDAYSTSTYTASGDTETSPGEAPCTTWTTTSAGIECNDNADADSSGHFDTDSEDCDEHDDIFTNPNCREFYDADGDIHYRDWSLTVTVNDDCASYRKTDLVGLGDDDDSDGTDDGEANCEASGGYFDSTTSACTYYGYSEESFTCNERANGCRAYTGGRSGNSRVALEETFEDGDLTAWDAASSSTVEYSNESIATDGHSLASTGETVWTFLGGDGTECEETTEGAGCEESAVSLGGTCTVDDGDAYCGTLEDELYAGKTYTLSFWAKGDGSVTVGFDIDANTSSIAFGTGDAQFDTIDLSASGWEEYRLGPLNMTDEDYADFGAGTVLAFIPASSSVDFYIDNIVLREGEDSITVIKDSWETPDECDETPEGTASAQYYLGCQEYLTAEDDTAYLKSFSSLCSEEVVGCEAYFTTEQSESPYAQVYGATCERLDTDTSTAVDCYYNTSSGAFDTTTPYLCTIGIGETDCTFDMEWYVPDDELPSHISYGPSTHIVPADTSKYLVVDEEDECLPAEAGCMEVGLPTFSQDRTQVTSSESTYLLNDPDDYADILCAHADLFCEAWESDDEGTYYFKDPGEKTCEYRTDVTINNVTYDGWFRTGTDEFCYGDGGCSESGASCNEDADCGADGGECVIDVGSYVIGGEESGIWRNGDDDYDGWVGSCDEEYSTCTEFQDLMQLAEGDIYGESDGESYVYLDNSQLEESTLASSQQCDGEVSQKEGCVLFNDTTDSGQDYNASASYVASVHADVLFGDDEFALVDPISCDDEEGSTITTPDGEYVDLCAQRCVYDAEYDGSAAGMLFANGLEYGSNGTYSYGRDDMYQFGQSCYDDSDCPSLTDIYGDEMAGYCASSVDIVWSSSSGTIVGADVPRLDDDSNRILKVNRDRECSEWLTCADSQEVWDERTGSYRTICEDIDLCTSYSGAGDTSFCSEWDRDDIASVLGNERYTDRDVSWYGHEYSGLAIPELLPVQMLDQKNVAPPSGYCDLTPDYAEGDELFDEYQGDECETDAECGAGVASGYCIGVGDNIAEDDYRLVYDAGSCDEPYGASCTVGYCEDTGATCSNSDQCGDADCIVGTCYTVSTTDCSSDAECGDGEVCLGTVCAEDEGDLEVGDSCGSGETLYENTVVQNGTCIRDECLVTPDGQPVDIADTEAKSCRAYPEVDSPFPNEVVSEWLDPDDGETSVTSPFEGVDENLENVPDMIPYSFVTGYDNVNWCAGGEDCVCSYKMVSYGDNDQKARYYGLDSDFPIQSVGICIGGGFEGAYCSKTGGTGSTNDSTAILESTCENGYDEDEDGSYDGTTDVKGGGTCQYPTKEDMLLGLDGYCLERDTGINIHGNNDEDHGACVSWLPVDQLAGSTDLYAKYLNAGWNGGDVQYCAYQETVYDVGPSGVPVTGTTSEGEWEIGSDWDGKGGTGYLVACAEQETWGGDCSSESADECDENAVCPDGFFAVVGGCVEDGNDSAAAGTPAAECLIDAGDNDCPYICVPQESWNDTTDEECGTAALVAAGFDVANESATGTSAGSVLSGGNAVLEHNGDFNEFLQVYNWLRDCKVRGLSSDEAEAYYGSEVSLNTAVADDPDYFTDLTLGYNALSYDACTVLVAPVDESVTDHNYAWTDRLLNQYSEYSPYNSYTVTTEPSPFGATDDPSSVINYSDAYPFIPDDEDNLTARSYGTTAESVSTVLGRIDNLFARLVGAFLFDTDAGSDAAVGSLGSYEEEDIDSNITTLGGSDRSFQSDVRASEGTPPSVWALDLADCDGTE